MDPIIIPLTARQAVLVRWAVDVMPDYFCVVYDDDGQNEHGSPVKDYAAIPRLTDGDSQLVLSDVDTTKDLCYRLGTQLYDMAAAEGTSAAYGQARAAQNVVDKIVAAMPYVDFNPALSGF